jgi:DNA (cytosine-5)-methyltransferase 1
MPSRSNSHARDLMVTPPKTPRLIKDDPWVKLNRSNSRSKIKIVDLFAGIGGFHFGIAAAASDYGYGVKTILASELDESCRNTYEVNHGCAVEGDVNKVLLTDYRNQTADIVTAGFPCQPFSNSGRKLGLKDPRGKFYDRIEEIILHFESKAFILENVPGMTTNGGGTYRSLLADQPQTIGKTMHTLEMKLAALRDYHVKWLEVDSSELGSPQVRRRVYIVGLRKDFADSLEVRIREFAPRSFLSIADPESAENSDLDLSENQDANVRSFMNRPPSYKDGMRRVGKAYLCEGGNVGQAYHAYGMVPTLTKIWARFLPIYFPHPKERALPSLDERLFEPDFSHYGKGRLRRASVREVMLLQGFPKSFRPHENPARAYEHAGNAVNAKVVREIARSLLGYIHP